MRWLQIKLVIACLLITLGPRSGFSQAPVEGRGIGYVEGSVDCGMWIKARSQGRAATFEHYVIGTLNGMVLGQVIEFWRIGEDTISRDQVFLWMDEFCRNKPLSNVTRGAWELFAKRGYGQIVERLNRDFDYIESLKRDPARGQ